MKKILAKKILVDIVFSNDVMGKDQALTVANTLTLHGGKLISLIESGDGSRLRIQSNEVTYTMLKEALFGLETEEIVDKNVKVLVIK